MVFTSKVPCISTQVGLQSMEKGSERGGWLGTDDRIYPEGEDAFEGGRVKCAVAAWVPRLRD